MKRMSSKQVLTWLAPVRKALASLKADSVDAMRGYPVVRVGKSDEYMRISHVLSGCTRCLSRLINPLDVSTLTRLETKLEVGTPLTVDEVDAAFRFLNSVELPLIRQSWDRVLKVSLDEQLFIEIERLKLA